MTEQLIWSDLKALERDLPEIQHKKFSDPLLLGCTHSYLSMLIYPVERRDSERTWTKSYQRENKMTLSYVDKSLVNPKLGNSPVRSIELKDIHNLKVESYVLCGGDF